MNSVAFLFYSHSDYRDLWPILVRNLHKLPLAVNKYICINDTAISCDILSSFTSILYYNDMYQYPQKLRHVLTQITEDYVVLIHDNDLIVRFDETCFDELMGIIIEKNIHRCMFGIVRNQNPEYMTSRFAIGTAKISTPHFITPYDVGPSVWNKKAFQSALETVQDCGYRDIERSSIQLYCIHNLNMYGFYSHPVYSSKYVIGRPFPDAFQFLHICGAGKLFESHLYMDQQEEFMKLIQEFPDIEKRGYLANQNHIVTTNRIY